MITCPKCRKQLPDGSKFCKFCGSAVPQVAPQANAPTNAPNPAQRPMQSNVQNPVQRSVQANAQRPMPNNAQVSATKKQNKKSSKGIIYAIIAVILVVAIAAGGWLLWDVLAEKNSGNNSGSDGKKSSSSSVDKDSDKNEDDDSDENEDKEIDDIVTSDEVPSIDDSTTSMGIDAEIGDYITFGTYEQDNVTTNGAEEIEWLVLDKQDGKILVISRYALDCRPYNETYEDITWENCTLRSWLNNEFLNTAFTSTERSMIPTVTVSADANPDYSTDLGNDTQDKVFLLSASEANKYFLSDSEKIYKPTAYAKAQGVWENYYGNCWWWLRSPGRFRDNAAYVESEGHVDTYGISVSYNLNAVCPALWINL